MGQGRYVICAVMLMMAVTAASAQEVITELPAPQTSAGVPLMQALGQRQSRREFRQEALTLQTVSDLLWAAAGVNRPDGKRTAPTAGNAQEIEIYAATAEAVYRYNPRENTLETVLAEDVRPLCGQQDFVAEAPVVLIFAAETSRMKQDAGLRDFYIAVDTGYVSQNVYLFCASEGLATVAIGWFDHAALAAKMGLNETRKVILTQPVGLPR